MTTATDANGSDTYCAGSLQTGRIASGPQNLGLWCYRCLTTPQGTLQGVDEEDQEEPAFGVDLAGFVGRTDSRDVRAAFGPTIRAALLHDRIRDVSTTVTATSTSDGLVSYTLAIRVLPVASDTPLTLTIAVSSVSVDLLGIAT